MTGVPLTTGYRPDALARAGAAASIEPGATRQLALALGASVLASLALAWSQRFIQDDAFVSLRYARNLARGLGLVYNPGERVEGYTNFLWTMWLSLPFRLGLDPVVFAFASGLVLYAATLLLAVRLTRTLLPASAAAPLMLLVIVGANHTFSAYATSGMETTLQTCLVLATFALLIGTPLRTSRVLLASTLAGLALLTRLDSVLLLAPGLVVAGNELRTEGARRRWTLVAAGVGPALCMVGTWLAWKQGYYGSLLPNTWYVKSTGVSFVRGIAYVGSFLILTLFVLVLGPAVAAWIGRLRQRDLPERAAWLGIGCGTAAWLAYVIAVGGDFMEYRLMVPVLPWLTLLVVAGLMRSRPEARWIVAGALAVAGLIAPLWPSIPGISPTHLLAELAADWKRVGVALSVMAPARPPLVIGVTGAGTVPFYSELETVDLFGLTDPWTARHGDPVRPRIALVGTRPGHSRIATPDHIVRRGVHLFLNALSLAPAKLPEGSVFSREELERRSDPDASWRGRTFPPGARVLEIPVDHGAWVYAIQLRAHPAVDSAVASGRWRAFALR